MKMMLLSGQVFRMESQESDRFKGYGGYDKFGLQEVLGDKVRQVIPPPKNGVITLSKKGKPVPEDLIQRNQAIEYIQKEGLKAWKNKEGNIPSNKFK